MPERPVIEPARASTHRHDVAGILMLVLVTVVWGTTFAVIKATVDSVPPSVLVLVRFLVAAVLLTMLAGTVRLPWRRGLDLGFWLWLGYACQAHGLQFTTAGRSAFITAISVVLVAALVGVMGRRVPAAVWLSAGVALAGVALLTSDGAPPNRGDLWTGVTALSYAWFVIRLERHAACEPVLPLAAAQLWGVVPFAAGWAAFELLASPTRTLHYGWSAWLALGYLAVVATAVTTWLQTAGQRRVAAPEAAIVYALEPVWAAAFAAWALGERLGAAGMVGALLVVAAVLASQSPALARRRPRRVLERRA